MNTINRGKRTIAKSNKDIGVERRKELWFVIEGEKGKSQIGERVRGFRAGSHKQKMKESTEGGLIPQANSPKRAAEGEKKRNRTVRFAERAASEGRKVNARTLKTCRGGGRSVEGLERRNRARKNSKR